MSGGNSFTGNQTVNGTIAATSFSGNGSGLTSLNAANLSGALPAISGANLTNLPANAALLGANQTFTGQNSFAGIFARGGQPGPTGANNNGYAFSGNGGDGIDITAGVTPNSFNNRSAL